MSTATPATADQRVQVTEFVDRFAKVWAAPSVAGLETLVRPDVEFIQPLEPTVRGHEEVARFWNRLFALIPDVTGEIVSWGFGDDAVYIELRMSGTLGGKPVEWVTLDRIRLEDGRVRQRVAYFDPLPLVRSVATRPKAWPTWVGGRLRGKG